MINIVQHDRHTKFFVLWRKLNAFFNFLSVDKDPMAILRIFYRAQYIINIIILIIQAV